MKATATVKVRPLWQYCAIVARWLNGELPESRAMADQERFDLALAHTLLRAGKFFDEMADLKCLALGYLPDETPTEDKRAIAASEQDYTHMLEGDGITAYARAFQCYRNAVKRMLIEFERTGHVVDASVIFGEGVSL